MARGGVETSARVRRSGRGGTPPRRVTRRSRTMAAGRWRPSWPWRTAVRGAQGQPCPEGPVERRWSPAGRHRVGPSWAWGQGAPWLATPKARLCAGEPSQVRGPLPPAPPPAAGGADRPRRTRWAREEGVPSGCDRRPLSIASRTAPLDRWAGRPARRGRGPRPARGVVGAVVPRPRSAYPLGADGL
jgi:hypothetical protein